jgi:hypothetical protein
MTTPAHDVAQYIADNVAGFVLGVNLKVGDEDIPVATGRDALVINVSDTPGIDAEPFVDGGKKSRVERPSVNVRVRGDKDDALTLHAVATLLVDVLDMATIGPWAECRVSGGAALNLGRDDDGFPRVSINARLRGCVEQFPIYCGAAAVPGVIDQAWLDATLVDVPRGRRNLTHAATALSGHRLWAAFPQTFSGPVAAPFRMYDGLTSRTPLATTLMASGVSVLVHGAAVLYDVHASTAAVAAGAHIVKVL